MTSDQKLGPHIEEVKEIRGHNVEEEFYVYSVTNINGFELSKNFTSEDLSNYKRIRSGFFAYNPYRINVGSIGLAKKISNGLVSPAYVVFKTKKSLNEDYLLMYLKSGLGLDRIRFFGRGSVRSALRYDDLAKIEIPIPTLAEQESFVEKMKELESQVAQINMNYDKQIHALYQCMYSILLDLIKKENNIFKLIDLCSYKKGSFPTMKTAPGKYPFIVTSGDKRSADSYDIEGPAICIPMISSTGHGHASLNRIFFVEGKFALANIIGALKTTNSSVIPKFLYYYLLLMKDELLVRLMTGTANVSLSPKDLLQKVTIHLPSKSKQIGLVKLFESMEHIIDQKVKNKDSFRLFQPSMKIDLFKKFSYGKN